MKPILEIATGAPSSSERVEYAREAAFLSPGVVADLAGSVGVRSVESGAMLDGPSDRDGCDLAEFDASGSRAASAVAYRPDVAWANARQEFHLRAKPQRVWDGFCHSHVRGCWHPSEADARGNGDMGFASAAIEGNDHMRRFLLFILTGAQEPAMTLWPWVVEREDPTTPRLASVVITEPALFPPRRFPEALTRAAEPRPSASLVVGLQVDQIAELARTEIALTDRTLTTKGTGPVVEAYLPSGFPAVAPVLVVNLATSRRVVPVWWAARSKKAVELRLAKAIRQARACAREV